MSQLNRIFCTLIILVFFCCRVCAQSPPYISYPTPVVVKTDASVSITPTNTGGAVPPGYYGMVTTFAGSGRADNANGTGTAADFNTPKGIVADKQGNIYVSDAANNRIQKISPAGVVTTLAGGSSGIADGKGAAAQFGIPGGLAIDEAGNIYVADGQNHMIRKVTPDGVVTTVAGSGVQGAANGSAANATFNQPQGLAIDAAGNIYVADSGNNLVRKIDANTGMVSTLAGDGTPALVNGQGKNASFNGPIDICVDSQNNLYVLEYENNDIRKIDEAGNVTTYAGTGAVGDNDGAPLSATFHKPYSIAIDIYNNMYICEEGGLRIRELIYNDGVNDDAVITLAGSGALGNTNGPDAVATFSSPTAVAVNADGNIYVADTENNLIREIGRTGYTIDHPLPAGLNFDVTTGIITGTPTVASPAQDYRVSAYTIYGYSVFTFSLAITGGLNFPAIPAKTTCDADFDPGATSSQGTLTYTSSDTRVATIVNGKVHIISAGTCTITASDGTETQAQKLTVNAPLVATIQISPPGYISSCDGLQLTFTTTATNAGSNPTYQWQVNGQNAGNNSSVFTTGSNDGDKITCTLTNTTDCTTGPVTSAATIVTASPYVTPTISIQSSSPGQVGMGLPVTFTATTTNGGSSPSYQWTVNGTVAGNNSPTYTYTCPVNGDQVACELSVASGKCYTTLYAASNVITMDVVPLTITISASASTIYSGNSVTFIASTNGTGATYQWTVNGISKGSNSSSFTTSSLQNGDVVTCKVLTAGGCSQSVTSNSITITVLPQINTSLVIPNAFTPNGDGINDEWNIPGLTAFPNCSIDIYTRYGSSVYHSTKGYAIPWDGTYKGRQLPSGTYYYVINLGNNTQRMSGFVALIR